MSREMNQDEIYHHRVDDEMESRHKLGCHDDGDSDERCYLCVREIAQEYDDWVERADCED